MAMVNMNNLLNMKDSRWLQLEVCREFQRNKCSRPDTECKFAHPPVNVEVQNGRVTACYDSIKGRCNREKPPCKYFHPPLHLKDQLLINGRNHLALKNALMQQMGMGPGQSVVPGQVPAVATNPYLGVANSYNPYFPTGPLVSLVSDPSGTQVTMAPLGVPQQAVIQQKELTPLGFIQRRFGPVPPPWMRSAERDLAFASLYYLHLNQRFASTASRQTTTVARASPDSTTWNQGGGGARVTSYPGMVTYKRPAEKGGVPVYPQGNSASAAAYQHLMQLQQPFVPVSSSSLQQHFQAATSSTSTTATSPVHVTTSVSPETTNGQVQSADTSDLDNGPVMKKLKGEVIEEGGHDEGTNGVGSTKDGGGTDEESKEETALKRMRINAGGTPPHATLSLGPGSATAVMVQNSNAAYAAAAQNYHSAIAAMTYTGASLQAQNKVPTPIPTPTQHAQASIQSQLQYPAAALQQQQQNQQQQFLQQYQAMAAAAFASQAGFGGQGTNATAANSLATQQLSAGFPLAMNPYLAAFPQLAAAQRAQLLQQQQGAAAMAGVAGAFGSVQGLGGGGGTGFNPFGIQLGTGLTAANIQQFQQSQQQQQQQAILAAAYGQFAARAPVSVPVVSAAPSLTQQLYIGNPVAHAQGANGPLQAAVGVKRMRPG